MPLKKKKCFDINSSPERINWLLTFLQHANSYYFYPYLQISLHKDNWLHGGTIWGRLEQLRQPKQQLCKHLCMGPIHQLASLITGSAMGRVMFATPQGQVHSTLASLLPQSSGSSVYGVCGRQDADQCSLITRTILWEWVMNCNMQQACSVCHTNS